VSARVMWRGALVAVMCGVVTACVRRDGTAGGAPAGDAVVVRLERGPCRGFCPVYAVEVTRGGRVRWVGQRHVADTGRRERTVSASTVSALLARFDATTFATTDTAITQDHMRCGAYITDLPSTTLSGPAREVLRTVRYDRGCAGVPRFLDVLAGAVDSVAQTAQWIGGNK
jgi:hypothetical protein